MRVLQNQLCCEYQKTEEDLESLKISLQDYIESNLDKKAQINTN